MHDRDGKAYYNKQLKYLSKASLFKYNDGLGHEFKKKQDSLADGIKKADYLYVKLKE